MGVDLDWVVDAAGGPHRVGEDPAEIARRQRRTRLRKRALVIAAVVALVATIAALIRYREVQQWRHAMLRATVESEMTALRIGDEHAFMKRQSSDADWRLQQMRTFRQFQALIPQVEIPGEIVEMRVEGDQATATVLERVNGETLAATWLYEYTDAGWRHVTSPPEPWSQFATLALPGFHLSYFQPDEPLARSLGALLSEWRAQAEALLGTSDLPRLEIRIEPGSGPPTWEEGAPPTLVISSQGASGRLSQPDGALRGQLAEMVAPTWGRAAVGGPLERVNQWAEDEVAAALRHAFDPSAPPPAVMGPLGAAFGPDLLPAFAASLRADRPPPLAMRDAMRSAAPGELSGEALRAYLTAFLQAEAGLRNALLGEGRQTDTRVQYIFSDALMSGPAEPVISSVSTEPTDPASITVLSMQLYGEVLWVDLRYQGAFQAPNLTLPISKNTSIPFRLFDGYWTRAVTVSEAELGEEVTRQQGLVTVTYREADGMYVELVMHHFDPMYRQAAADMGLASPPPIQMAIVFASFDTRAVDPHTLMVHSPHRATCIPAQKRRDCLLNEAREVIAQGALNLRLQELGAATDRPMGYALVMWETRRLGGATVAEHVCASIAAMPDSPLPGTPGDLWLEQAGSVPEQAMDLLGTMALLDVIAEAYGIEAIHALIAHLPEASSMEEWLVAGVGIAPAEVEAAWQARLGDMLAEYAAASNAEWSPRNDFMGEPNDVVNRQR